MEKCARALPSAPTRNANESYLTLIGRRYCLSLLQLLKSGTEVVPRLVMDGLVTWSRRRRGRLAGSTLSSSCSCFERFDKKEPIGMCAPFNRLPLALRLSESASIPGRAHLIARYGLSFLLSPRLQLISDDPRIPTQ